MPGKKAHRALQQALQLPSTDLWADLGKQGCFQPTANERAPISPAFRDSHDEKDQLRSVRKNPATKDGSWRMKLKNHETIPARENVVDTQDRIAIVTGLNAASG